MEAPIVVLWNLLVVNENMKENVAYDIVKTLFDHKPELVMVHSDAKHCRWNPKAPEALPSRFTRERFDISRKKG